ncbi:unnamed protein product [Camellia sinensis]
MRQGAGWCTGGLESSGGFDGESEGGLVGGLGDGEGTKESGEEACGGSGGNDLDPEGGNGKDENGEFKGETEGETVDGNGDGDDDGDGDGDKEIEGNGDNSEPLLVRLSRLTLGGFVALKCCSSLLCATLPS